MKTYGNIDINQLKAIIFDFDETMYSSDTIKEEYQEYIKRTVMSLSNHNEAETMKLMKEYGFLSDGNERVSFGKNCDKFGISKECWDNYRVNNFFKINFNNAKVVNNDLYKELSKICKLYIVSNEIKNNIIFKAEKLNIDLSNFTKIYAPTIETMHNYHTKMDNYLNIGEVLSCNSDEMCVIGDRYNVDILPMLEIGGKGLLISNVDEISTFIKKSINDYNLKLN